MSIDNLLQPKGQRKLLSLDGGGIRGLITNEILAALEDQLRGDRGEDFRLADEFDYVAGTSTGAIIAACVSLGMSVAKIRDFYLESGVEIVDKASLMRRFRNKYEDERIAKKLQDVIGIDTTLGSDALRTLLLIVMRNATTDSPWPLSNNPAAKYNRPERRTAGKVCNLDLPLWQLVRASTAAPATGSNAKPAYRSERSSTPLRPYSSIAIQTGSHILHAGTPLDDQARAIITAVNDAASGH